MCDVGCVMLSVGVWEERREEDEEEEEERRDATIKKEPHDRMWGKNGA